MRSRFASASVSSASTREDVAVRLDRLVDVTELVLEDVFARRRRSCDWTVLSWWRPRMSAYALASVSQPPSIEPASRGDLLARLLVERELLERADVDVERAHRVDELVFEQLGDAVVRREALVARLRFGGVRELRLVDADELLPLARCAVERLEDLGDLELLRCRRRRGLRGPRASVSCSGAALRTSR